MAHKTFRETLNTLFISSNFFRKAASFISKCTKIQYSRTGHRWQHGACALHAGYLRLQTHTQNMQCSFLSHYSSSCTNVSECYVIPTVAIWRCVAAAAAASNTHLTSFNTMFLSPSALMSLPTMSKPASDARTSITCSGSSTGMWYFFKPANCNCHDHSSRLS